MSVIDDALGFLNEPLAAVDFKVKPWHILAGAAGVGAIWYFFIRKNGPAVQAPMLTNGEAASSAPAAAMPAGAQAGQCMKIGVQTEDIYDEEHELLQATRAARAKGMKIWKVPTGRRIHQGRGAQFEEVVIWACPPGVKPGKSAPDSGFSPAELRRRAQILEINAKKMQAKWGAKSIHPGAAKLRAKAKELRAMADQLERAPSAQTA